MGIELVDDKSWWGAVLFGTGTKERPGPGEGSAKRRGTAAGALVMKTFAQLRVCGAWAVDIGVVPMSRQRRSARPAHSISAF